MKIIESKIDLSSTIYTDGFRVHDSLLKEGFRKHQRVEHGRNEFARGEVHVNEIEGFWSILKARLSKFRGLSSNANIFLHAKECEFRFNHRADNPYELILINQRNSPPS